jgi:hypothetical protein
MTADEPTPIEALQVIQETRNLREDAAPWLTEAQLNRLDLHLLFAEISRVEGDPLDAVEHCTFVAKHVRAWLKGLTPEG